MEIASIVVNIVVAFIYFILGPFLLPKLMRKTTPGIALISRAALTVFAVGCAVTHILIAGHTYTGEYTAEQTKNLLLLALPQLIGGYIFLIITLSYKKESLWKD